MTAPSNANTSGLAQDICERLDAILVEEGPMHPFGCATWEEASRVAIDMAKEVVVTAASAQAAIDTERATKEAAYERIDLEMARATAAEARADRLEAALIEALPFVESCEYDNGYKPGAVLRVVKNIRAALQQETQK